MTPPLLRRRPRTRPQPLRRRPLVTPTNGWLESSIVAFYPLTTPTPIANAPPLAPPPPPPHPPRRVVVILPCSRPTARGIETLSPRPWSTFLATTPASLVQLMMITGKMKTRINLIRSA